MKPVILFEHWSYWYWN